MILNAHSPPSKEMKDNAILSDRTYAGNLAILPTYDSHAETAVMTVLRVARSQHRGTKRWGKVPVLPGKTYFSYVTRSWRTYHLHRFFGSALPEKEVPVCEACPKLSSNSLKVVHWDIYIPRPRLVEISEEKTEFEVFLNSLMKAGGDWAKIGDSTIISATAKGMNFIFCLPEKMQILEG